MVSEDDPGERKRREGEELGDIIQIQLVGDFCSEINPKRGDGRWKAWVEREEKL